MNKTKYPIYVISKNRVDVCYTANFLSKDNMDFKIVVEPQETQKYANKFGQDKILTLPFWLAAPSSLKMCGRIKRLWIS